jgi:hypothetical protein
VLRGDAGAASPGAPLGPILSSYVSAKGAAKGVGAEVLAEKEQAIYELKEMNEVRGPPRGGGEGLAGGRWPRGGSVQRGVDVADPGKRAREARSRAGKDLAGALTGSPPDCPPQILETKVRKLEQLVKLKDAKIHTLMAKLQAAGLL